VGRDKQRRSVTLLRRSQREKAEHENTPSILNKKIRKPAFINNAKKNEGKNRGWSLVLVKRLYIIIIRATPGETHKKARDLMHQGKSQGAAIIRQKATAERQKARTSLRSDAGGAKGGRT